MAISKGTKILAFGGLLVWLFSSIQKNVNGIKNQLSFGKISSNGVQASLSALTLNLVIEVVNGSDTELPFDSFAGNLFLGDQILAPVTISNPTTLQAKQTTTVPVQVDISYFGLPQAIITLIQSGNFLNELRLKGNIKSGVLSIPVDRKLI